MQNSKVFGRLRAIQGLCIVFCGSSDFVADGEWLTMVMIATTDGGESSDGACGDEEGGGGEG